MRIESQIGKGEKLILIAVFGFFLILLLWSGIIFIGGLIITVINTVLVLLNH